MPSVLGGRPLLWGNVLQAAGTLRQHSACRHSTWWAFSTPSQERAAGRQRPGVQRFYTCKQDCKKGNFFFSEVHTCGRFWQAGLLLPLSHPPPCCRSWTPP